ncbi:MAG: transcription termination/antitermination factor NusG [Thermoguttaceae bacterium]|nr:transcription termination/antitermination factor NusG [Thermoguttaceae bacterium]
MADQADATEKKEGADAAPQWYILKVQVNREDHVQRELQRRVALAKLDKFVEQILVPVERYIEVNKNGRKREAKRKLYPGYIMVKMVLNDDTWFLMRDTPGVGDFTGSYGKPLPMTPEDVERMLKTEDESASEQPKLEIPFSVGDRVKIKEGTFQETVGTVASIEADGVITVEIVFLTRTTPVQLEYWQVEKVEVSQF